MTSDQRPVVVIWEDAFSLAHYTGDGRELTPAIQRSVGWIIHRGDDKLILASSRCEATGEADIIFIPNCLVIEIEETG